MSIPNIIIAGCSLSVDKTSLDIYQQTNSQQKLYLCYPYFTEQFYRGKYKIHNIARDASDNGTISRNINMLVEDLWDKDMHDMMVIVQWSGLDRHSMFVEEDYCSGTAGHPFYRKKYNGWSLSSLDGTHERWSDYYLHEHSEEKATQSTLDNISKTQQFLKSKGIKYKMFCGWQIFSNDLNINEHIDTSDFIFFENDTGSYNDVAEWNDTGYSKYGGMKEWIRHNVDNKYWTRGEGDQHPHNIAQEKFTYGVILNLVDEMDS